MSKPDQFSLSQVREFLTYDPETGELRWTDAVRRRGFAGRVAGSSHSRGYVRVGLMGVDLFAHRLAWLLHYGVWPDGEIDHINHDKRDNRIENLRVVGRAENTRNGPLRADNKSGRVGVYWSSAIGKWRAQIGCGPSFEGLGSYDHKEDAVAAREAAEARWGMHKNHGAKHSRSQRKRDAIEREQRDD